MRTVINTIVHISNPHSLLFELLVFNCEIPTDCSTHWTKFDNSCTIDRMNRELSLCKTILNTVPRIHVAIIGDFCLDVYNFIDRSESEISIETGLWTLPVKDHRYSPGGAGNVAANLLDMGVGKVSLFGVVGDDMYGKKMHDLLSESGSNTENLIIQGEGWDTLVYTKCIDGDKELPRLDFGNYNELSDETADKLLLSLEESLFEVDAAIINQQVLRGIHTDYFRRSLRTVIQHHPDVLFLVDSRDYPDEYEGALRKLNRNEAERVLAADDAKTEASPGSASRDEEIAEKLYKRWEKPLFLTLGENGCLVRDEKGARRVFGLHVVQEVDTVGAGDSMLAGIAAGIGCGHSAEEAAVFGNLTAGVTIRKLFITGTAKPPEILEAASDPDYRYNPEKAGFLYKPMYAVCGSDDGREEPTEIEIVTKLPVRMGERKFKYAVFDHDGTISTLREGWESVMEPMMIKAILGGGLSEVSDKEREEVQTKVRQFIEKTTGIQTLSQMDALTRMVASSGYVPNEEIEDASGYKEIYNRSLMEMVEKRIVKVRKKELTVEDVTIKGSLSFLHALKEWGVVLYLASGTDADDVRREAELLGYASFFNGGIYGAIGDMTVDPKQTALKAILDTIGDDAADRIVTFGDGPVELRETKKRGGYTVGVASDEKKRFGYNPRKRERLVLSGADLLVPDFSQTGELLEVLFHDR